LRFLRLLCDDLFVVGVSVDVGALELFGAERGRSRSRSRSRDCCSGCCRDLLLRRSYGLCEVGRGSGWLCDCRLNRSGD